MEYNISIADSEAENKRTMKLETYALEKALLKDPVQRKLRRVEALEKIYSNTYLENFNVTASCKEDVFQSLADRFVQSVMGGDASSALAKSTKI